MTPEKQAYLSRFLTFLCKAYEVPVPELIFDPRAREWDPILKHWVSGKFDNDEERGNIITLFNGEGERTPQEEILSHEFDHYLYYLTGDSKYDTCKDTYPTRRPRVGHRIP